jgi:hypothetical protein
MPSKKRASKRRGRKKALPVAGVVGAVSLLLAGGASAGTAGSGVHIASRDTAPAPEITLNEEEISDVSLGTFYVFDKESAGTPRFGEKYAAPPSTRAAVAAVATGAVAAPGAAAADPERNRKCLQANMSGIERPYSFAAAGLLASYGRARPFSLWSAGRAETDASAGY